jgi:hypothetical protein
VFLLEDEPEKTSVHVKDEKPNLLIRIWRHNSDPPDRLLSYGVIIMIVAMLSGMMMLKTGKPVIYLYPEYPMDITVSLDYNGKLRSTYPKYDDGWSVTAYPDGTIVNHADGGEYSYLFWDGDSSMRFDFSSGFVVERSESAEFLREKLAYMGLTPKEYNEFIVYWLPLMEKNRYNLVSFQGAAYTDNAALYITPEPDSVLRVFMAFKPLLYPVEIPPQELVPFERRGFTVVEWGGSEVRF